MKSTQLRFRSTLSSFTRRTHANPYGLIAWTNTTARSGGRSTPSRSHVVWHRLPANPSTPWVPEITSSRLGASGRSQDRDVGRERAAVGPRLRMGVVAEVGAREVGPLEERRTRGLIVGREPHGATASPAAVTANQMPPTPLPLVSPGAASPVKP